MRKKQNSTSNRNYESTAPHSMRELEPYEFLYPHGTRPKPIYVGDLNKEASKWDLKLHDENDLRTAYEKLYSRLMDYNVYLTTYNHITKQNQCCKLTEYNCSNYHHARKLTSKVIYNFFDNSSSITKNQYTS